MPSASWSARSSCDDVGIVSSLDDVEDVVVTLASAMGDDTLSIGGGAEAMSMGAGLQDEAAAIVAAIAGASPY